jgi:hypothetical protein
VTRPPTPEFARPLAVADIGDHGRQFAEEASPAERQALARRFGLVSIEALCTYGCLEREAKGERVHLRAHLAARVTQTCVVSLAPVATAVDLDFERLYSPVIADEWADLPEPDRERAEALGENLFAEPLVGGLVDVGEAAAEQLALELDPFPRAPGAVFPGMADGNDEPGPAAAAAGPFAALATWRRRPQTSR